VSLYTPYISFDTDAPIQDMDGLDDEIRNAWGRGLTLGYRFTVNHALQGSMSWVDSDGEDNRGMTYFAIRTRYAFLTYQWSWKMGERLMPYFLVGPGYFSARAKSAEHVSFGGVAYALGGGLRYQTSSRSSAFLMVQTSHVDLDRDNADNLMVAIGLTAHLGHRAKSPVEETPSAEELEQHERPKRKGR
jgi:opacity protein-like surface antigen